MSRFTVLLFIVFAVGILGFIDEETGINYFNGTSIDEPLFDQIDEWNDKIVGGINAEPGQFPHQVSLRNRNNINFCGGSILTRFFIMTAAHCTRDRIPKNIGIRVGTHRLSDVGILYQALSIHSHPKFDRKTYANDISLVSTTNEILYNTPNVRPVRLGLFNVPNGSLRVRISGWGATNQKVEPYAYPDVLQFKDAFTLNRLDCAETPEIDATKIFENTICVRNPIGRGACLADAGSALLAGNNVQVGIYSWNVPCARGIPDIYANVFMHDVWISQTVKANTPK